MGVSAAAGLAHATGWLASATRLAARPAMAADAARLAVLATRRGAPQVALAPADAAQPASLPARHTLIRELLVVGMVFPLPAIATAVISLTQAAAGVRQIRLPELLPGDPAGSALLLTLQILADLAPPVLIWYLLGRSGETLRDIGLDRSQPGRDALRAAGLVVLAFVAAATLGSVLDHLLPHASFVMAVGHRLSLFLLLPGLTEALRAGVIEEIAVTGYLLHRLEQLGVGRGRALLISVAVRLSYHVYYGVGALAVIPFGLLFGWMWQRNRRLVPLIAAHASYDGLLFGIAIAAGG